MLTSLQDFIAAAEELAGSWPGEVWWRGHASNTFVLQPSVHRHDRGPRGEQNLTLRFRQYAPTRHANCPPQEDFISWLFLMQHYGLPTRLLDWSASVLVATCFAVTERPNEDGVVFAIDPRRMNNAMIGDPTLVPTTSSPARDLFVGAFDDRQSENRTIAVLTHEVDDRMLVQQAAFTIHGDKQPLDAHPDVANFLRRFDIPAIAKQRLHSQLKIVGFRRSTLFPDLANLALDLRDLVFLS